MSTRDLVIEQLGSLSEAEMQALLLYLLRMKGEEIPPETLAAMQEVEEMKRNPEAYPGYTDIDEVMKELLS